MMQLITADYYGRVQGCVRLLPSTGPTMLRDTFPVLLGPQRLLAGPSGRVADSRSTFILTCRNQLGLAAATFELFAGMRVGPVATTHRDRDRH
jgi:acyl homoserine lactone synthase